mmetsp:Transcript_21327/g.69016  ORF Transcript_21327/g.69016 Transcript_21327/m.69016 type:complete len:526 (-) Transcript_21327:74-1651(-)|eukprot:CAMPEP_0170144542 /NCGR_PEP_ID=MMETSP0033_2-20121228/14282_1 /TAXON_ID=195969 /ORGANISM="Dolichomastix tenuilepis, Strain CCMP3274" /LENGTH=525 /DNA_ID=CAMNT_0010381047 /DNA_START=31 /DNA_END=1608 /DNA_ORIENTATION=+
MGNCVSSKEAQPPAVGLRDLRDQLRQEGSQLHTRMGGVHVPADKAGKGASSQSRFIAADGTVPRELRRRRRLSELGDGGDAERGMATNSSSPGAGGSRDVTLQALLLTRTPSSRLRDSANAMQGLPDALDAKLRAVQGEEFVEVSKVPNTVSELERLLRAYGVEHERWRLDAHAATTRSLFEEVVELSLAVLEVPRRMAHLQETAKGGALTDIENALKDRLWESSDSDHRGFTDSPFGTQPVTEESKYSCIRRRVEYVKVSVRHGDKVLVHKDEKLRAIGDSSESPGLDSSSMYFGEDLAASSPGMVGSVAGSIAGSIAGSVTGSVNGDGVPRRRQRRASVSHIEAQMRKELMCKKVECESAATAAERLVCDALGTDPDNIVIEVTGSDADEEGAAATMFPTERFPGIFSVYHVHNAIAWVSKLDTTTTDAAPETSAERKQKGAQATTEEITTVENLGNGHEVVHTWQIMDKWIWDTIQSRTYYSGKPAQGPSLLLPHDSAEGHDATMMRQPHRLGALGSSSLAH